MPKKVGAGVPAVLGVRLAQEDAARLDALAARLPMLGGAGGARACLLHGLASFEAAAAEKDETKRLAALARLLGVGGSGKR